MANPGKKKDSPRRLQLQQYFNNELVPYYINKGYSPMKAVDMATGYLKQNYPEAHDELIQGFKINSPTDIMPGNPYNIIPGYVAEGINVLRGKDASLFRPFTSEQQFISESLGIKNPYGALAIDIGAGLVNPGVLPKGLNTIGKKAVKQVGNKSKFKSEIDWNKWNKEIPKNKALMREYNAIEQQAKSNGTWMKNPDGSDFQGTPEQFVQQNSENFKKFYKDSKITGDNGEVLKMYHGSPNKNITEFKMPGTEGYKKSPTTTTGESGIYFSDKKDYADLYQDFTKTNNKRPGKTYEVYLAPKTAITAGEEASLKGLPPTFLWNHGKVPVDAVKAGKYMRRVYPEAGFEVAMENPNLIKSAIGNNGMFDITNPNIYKGLVPLGLGYGAYQTQQSNKYQEGGYNRKDQLRTYFNNELVPYYISKGYSPMKAVDQARLYLRKNHPGAHKELIKGFSINSPTNIMPGNPYNIIPGYTAEAINYLRGKDASLFRPFTSDQQAISQALGVNNPYAALAVDLGAGLVNPGVLPKGLNKIGRKALKNAGKKSSNFKSEIDWRNWVKYKEDFDNNPKVIKELVEIEKTSKANGTWMKNPDGSEFKGTPEQFVVQQSENFKKAFPKGSDISYRGDLSEISEIKSQQELGRDYVKQKYNLKDDNQSHLVDKIWEKNKNKLNAGKYTTNEYDAALKYAGGDEGKVLHVYTDIRNPKFTSTDESFKVLEKDRQRFLSEGYDALITKPSSFYPEGENVLLKNNQIKSAVGNIMLDMTNPNIYKGLVPLGLGYGAYQNQQSNKYQEGGYANTPYERKMGLLAGKNKFRFPFRGNHQMTMTPGGMPISFPVYYQGLVNNQVVDQGVAMPGQDFSAYGDEIHEYPMYKNGGLAMTYGETNPNSSPTTEPEKPYDWNSMIETARQETIDYLQSPEWAEKSGGYDPTQFISDIRRANVVYDPAKFPKPGRGSQIIRDPNGDITMQLDLQTHIGLGKDPMDLMRHEFGHLSYPNFEPGNETLLDQKLEMIKRNKEHKKLFNDRSYVGDMYRDYVYPFVERTVTGEVTPSNYESEWSKVRSNLQQLETQYGRKGEYDKADAIKKYYNNEFIKLLKKLQPHEIRQQLIERRKNPNNPRAARLYSPEDLNYLLRTVAQNSTPSNIPIAMMGQHLTMRKQLGGSTYSGKGGAAGVSYTPEAAQAGSGFTSRIRNAYNNTKQALVDSYNDFTNPTNFDFEASDRKLKMLEGQMRRTRQDSFNSYMDYVNQYPNDDYSDKIRERRQFLNPQTNNIDTNMGYSPRMKLQMGGMSDVYATVGNVYAQDYGINPALFNNNLRAEGFNYHEDEVTNNLVNPVRYTRSGRATKKSQQYPLSGAEHMGLDIDKSTINRLIRKGLLPKGIEKKINFTTTKLEKGKKDTGYFTNIDDAFKVYGAVMKDRQNAVDHYASKEGVKLSDADRNAMTAYAYHMGQGNAKRLLNKYKRSKSNDLMSFIKDNEGSRVFNEIVKRTSSNNPSSVSYMLPGAEVTAKRTTASDYSEPIDNTYVDRKYEIGTPMWTVPTAEVVGYPGRRTSPQVPTEEQIINIDTNDYPFQPTDLPIGVGGAGGVRGILKRVFRPRARPKYMLRNIDMYSVPSQPTGRVNNRPNTVPNYNPNQVAPRYNDATRGGRGMRPTYYKEGGYLQDKDTYITKDGKKTRRGLWSNVYLKKKREGNLKKAKEGDRITPANEAIKDFYGRVRNQYKSNEQDPYKIHSSDVPLASMAYNAFMVGRGPDEDVTRQNLNSAAALSTMNNMAYRPNYNPAYRANNMLTNKIRSSTTSVPQMMSQMQNATSNLQNKMMDVDMQAGNVNNQYRGSYAQLMANLGAKDAAERARVDQINAQNRAAHRSHAAANAKMIDNTRGQKRTLDNAKIEHQLELAGINASVEDLKFKMNPDGTMQTYYRDPVTGMFHPINYKFSNAPAIPTVRPTKIALPFDMVDPEDLEIHTKMALPFDMVDPEDLEIQDLEIELSKLGGQILAG